MAALSVKRTAGAQGAHAISEVEVRHDSNSAAGWVYKVLKNETLYTSLSAGNKTEVNDAIVAATMDALTPGS